MASEVTRCGATVPLFQTGDADPLAEVFALALLWSLAYLLLWLVLGAVGRAFLAAGRLSPSIYAEENEPLCVSQHLCGVVKCLVLIPTSNAATYLFFTAPPEDLGPQNLAYRLTEICGLLFIACEMADCVIIVVNRKLSVDNVLHHTTHLTLAWLLRGNCLHSTFVGVTVAALATQETSSVFLNVFLLMRNRGADSGWLVRGAFVCFAVSFYLWRLGLGTWNVHHYLAHTAEAPPLMPTWQVALLGCALAVGNVLQWYWGVMVIGRKLVAIATGEKSAKEKKAQ